jgi:autotransporter-associated beta strand protein
VLAWGQAFFLQDGQNLKLSSVHSDATLELTNGIDLGNQSRTVEVANGAAAVDAQLSGNLTHGGLIKTGTGVLALTGTNTYTGETRVNGGALLIGSETALSDGALVVESGVLMLGSGDFTRSLGTGAGQIRFISGGNGGFAAFGADRTVNLGGQGEQVTAGSGMFASGGGVTFSSTASDATLNFVNPINLNSTSGRPVIVENGTAAIDARLTGELSNGALVKSGAGVLELTAANTYTGLTRIDGGGLLISSQNALGSGALRIRNSSVLILGSGDMTRELGTNAGQVQVNIGGFAAYGQDRRVNIGNDSRTLLWGDGNFIDEGTLRLILGHEISNAKIVFENPIDLNAGADRRISAIKGTGPIAAQMAGAITNGGIWKLGNGVLELSANNTFSGQLRLEGGGILVTGNGTLGTGNLRFSGYPSSEDGVLILGNGDFTRSLGTGAGQVQFTANGGFAAYGQDRTVNLGGAGATLTWSSNSFIESGRTMILSHEISDATLIFVNGMDLGTTVQTIQVNDGSADIDARLTGKLVSGGLKKTGAGTLELTAVSSATIGAFFVLDGRLIVSGSGALPSANRVEVQGGEFIYQSSAVFDRRVVVDGGRFSYNSANAFTGALDFQSGTIGGTGNLSGTEITVGAGQSLAPGNSIGTLLTGSETWEGGGSFQWEVGDWNGTTPGEDWDLLSTLGTVTITANSASPFVVELSEYFFTGFTEEDRSFVFATASGGIFGFDADAFLIDASPLTFGSGQWSITQVGNSLALNYTAVPEPQTIGLILVALGAILLSSRRNRKKPTPSLNS